MKRWLYYIVSICTCCVSTIGNAQVCQTYGNIITAVTTDPLTGFQVIQWKDPAALNASAIKYIVYEYLGGAYCTQEITRVPITQHTYTDPVVPVSQKKYTIAIDIGTAYPEPITHEHGPAFIYECNYDACNYALQLKWNAYVGWAQSPEYRVYASEDGGANWSLKGTLSSTEFVIANLPDNVNYGVYVEAVNADDTNVRSISNTRWVMTATQKRPAYIDLTSIDYRNEESLLGFSLDLTADPAFQYIVQRAPSGTADFEQRGQFADKTQTSFRDTDVSTVFDYRLLAVNACNLPVRTSNVLNNIILSMEQEGSNVQLEWTASNIPGATYEIACVSPAVGTLATGIVATSVILPIPDMMAYPSLELCYRITAGNGAVSSSATACINYLPEIYMPDAVNPYSTVQHPTTLRRRNQFGPVINIHPSTYSYQLEIYSRNGTLVARMNKSLTDDPLEKSWNGTHKNGDIVREDIYTYSLKVTFVSGKTVSKTGTVTVIAEE